MRVLYYFQNFLHAKHKTSQKFALSPFLKVKNFAQNLVFFVQNFDNSIENNINFYNQFEFWKKVKYVLRNSILCNTCRPISIIKDRRCDKFWTHFCLRERLTMERMIRSTYTLAKVTLLEISYRPVILNLFLVKSQIVNLKVDRSRNQTNKNFQLVLSTTADFIF